MTKTKTTTANIKNENNLLTKIMWFLISSSIIIVAAIFVIIFAGFNTSFDFSGGSVLQIKLGSQLSKNAYYSESLNEVKDILNDYSINIYSVQLSGQLEDQSLVIKYKNAIGKSSSDMKEINFKIREDINQSFDIENFTELDDDFDITVNSGLVSGVLAKTLFKSIVSFVVLIAVTVLYFVFRRNILLALSIFGCVFFNLVLTLAVVALTRVPVGPSLVAGLFAISVLTILMLIIIYSQLEYNNDQKVKKSDLIVWVKPLIINSVVIAVFMGLLFILATNTVAEVVGTILIGIAVNIITLLFAGIPFVKIFADTKINKKKNKQVAEKTEKQVEKVEQESFAEKTDTSAPVIEIEDNN